MNSCVCFPVRLILLSCCQIFGKDTDLAQNIMEDVMRLNSFEPGEMQLVIEKDGFKELGAGEVGRGTWDVGRGM